MIEFITYTDGLIPAGLLLPLLETLTVFTPLACSLLICQVASWVEGYTFSSELRIENDVTIFAPNSSGRLAFARSSIDATPQTNNLGVNCRSRTTYYHLHGNTTVQRS